MDETLFLIGQNDGRSAGAGRRRCVRDEVCGMSARRTDRDDRPALPMGGLAGQLSFVCYWAHDFVACPGWTFPPPDVRSYATLWLIRSGKLRIDDGGETVECGSGALVCWPPDTERVAENQTGVPVTLYTVAFDLHVWGELDFFRIYRVPRVHQVKEFGAMIGPCRALVAELAAHDEVVTLEAEGWARVLVGRWLSEMESVGALLPAAGVDDRVSDVLAAIEDDLAGEWHLERLAGLSQAFADPELYFTGLDLSAQRA